MQSKYNILRLFELIFTVVSLFHLLRALTPLLLTGGASEGDGVDITAINMSLNAKISVLIYVITFILLFLRWKKVVALFRKDKSIWFIWLLVLIICLSSLWSVFPSETFKYSIYVIGTTGFGIYLATRYTIKEQIIIYSWTLSLIIFLSLFFIVALPKYGIMAAIHEGAWRGIFSHKNGFGQILVIAAVVYFLRALDKKSSGWFFWFLLACTIPLVILSRSSTSLVTLFVMLSLCFIYRIFYWRYELMISAILASVVIGILLTLWLFDFGGFDLILTALGKDSTLTGRTDIWHYSWDMVRLRPWQGYGLNAFWHGLQGPSAYVELALTVPVAYAHNGFLDMLLAIGFLGLAVFLVGLFSAALKAFALFRKTNSLEGFWPLLLLTYVFLYNFAEGLMTNFNNGYWAIYVATFFSLVIARDNIYSPALKYRKRWA